MKIKDLYKKPFGEVIEEYCILYNEECAYYYGIIEQEKADQIYEEYNIDEYPEAITTDSLIPYELILNDEEPLITQEKINKIMNNLGITKRKKE